MNKLQFWPCLPLHVRHQFEPKSKKKSKPMPKLKSTAVSILASALCVSGCAFSYQPEAGFGDSVRGAISKQTVNQSHALTDGVSPGLEGTAANATIQNYKRSFDRPVSLDNVLSIGIGSSGGASSGVSGQ
jgi:hypothetical protein